jgi:hypothetical protein
MLPDKSGQAMQGTHERAAPSPNTMPLFTSTTPVISAKDNEIFLLRIS